MASIVDISPPAPTTAPSVRKIRIASRGLEWVFTGLFVLFAALTAFGFWALLFYHGTLLSFGPKGGLFTTGPVPPDYLPLRDWGVDQRLAYVPVWAIRSAPMLGLFWCLRTLFRVYSRAEVFTERTARLIRWMGVWLVADAVLPFLCHLVLSATGYEIDKLWAHATSAQEAVLGAVVFVVALVMQHGHEIEQDREGFV